MKIFIILAVTFLFSLLMTWLMRNYAIRKNIMDVPNQRSSHIIPTPRGGGMAIVISFSLGVAGLAISGFIAANLALALLGGGIGVAAIGYIDDVYKVAARWRILAHLAIAIWAVYWLKGLPIVDLGTWKFALHNNGILLALIGIIWSINLYNFMDGIDGLAGSEGLFVSLAAGVALWFSNQPTMAFLLLFLAATIAGFTWLNWPPAKIFLGDAGSGFLGYVFAVLTLYTANTNSLPIVFWLIILAIFICDATFTLLYRILQGKQWYAAHREHAYQHLICWGASHKQVTLGIFLVNVLLILPVALLAQYAPWNACWLMLSLLAGLFVTWITIKSLKFTDR
jgi:Fuc2NAc and GlcNAc transferase